MLRGAIFDFDGTLFDSMFIWDTVGEVYIRSIGIEPEEELKALSDVFLVDFTQLNTFWKFADGI